VGYVIFIFVPFLDLDPFFRLEETPCGSVVSANQTLRLPLEQETQLYSSNMVIHFENG